jgi:hypothetical protein
MHSISPYHFLKQQPLRFMVQRCDTLWEGGEGRGEGDAVPILAYVVEDVHQEATHQLRMGVGVLTS